MRSLSDDVLRSRRSGATSTRGWGSRFLRLSCFLLAVVLAIFLPRIARAHDAGLSRGRYDLTNTTLAIDITFASRELANSLPAIDAATIDREIVSKLSVNADGTPCPIALDGVTATDQDGLQIKAHAQCPARPKHLTIHCGFIEALSSSHRHLALVALDDGGAPHETIAVAANEDVIVDVGAPRDAPTVPFFSLLKLGIEHILTGYDHLVFLFGLIVVGGRLRSLIGALTAFTIAHSISLALAVLGVWAPRPSIIEPAIALSIAFVGVENLWRASKKQAPNSNPDFAKGRWRITFPFGLIHGFGFAGALAEIGLPRAKIPLALFAFNLGVELGQLGVLAVALPIVLYARRFESIRGLGTRIANIAVVIAGLVWFIDRIRG